jgi:hypothetical protein
MARFGRTYVKLGLVRPVVVTGAVLTESPSDPEGLTDSASVTQAHSQVISDPAGLTDSRVLTQAENNTFSDPEGLTDSLVLSQTETFTKSDPEGLTDSLLLTLGQPYSASDPMGLTDSLLLSSTLGPPGPVQVGPEGELVLGPGTIYLGAYGAVEPSNGSVASVPNPAVWTDIGALLGGVELTVEHEWIEVELKQLPDRPMKRVKKRRLSVKTQMAEATLLNLAYALNDTAAVSAGTGWQQYVPSDRSEASTLTYNALIVDGWAPGFNNSSRRHKRRRLIMRKCLSIDNVQIQYSKDNQTVVNVTWTCHYVDSVTPPFRVIDEA